MATVGGLVVKIGTDISGLESGLNTAAGRLQSFGSSMRGIGTGLSLAVTTPLLGIATAAFKSAAGFEQSMNLMQATTGATESQMAALQQQALDLGASTSFSAGEAAEAMLELSKAGMSVEQTSAAIAGVMDLAAAGGIDLASAATITANAINSFGLEASEASNVANTFAAAANASSSSVEDLAQGFTNAGSVFAANGQSVNDLATALSIMSNNGIAGAEAGTQLKTMIMRLAAPTAEAAAQMDALGLNIYDSSGAMVPFGEIVAQLETAMSGMSDSQRNAAMDVIFGTHAMNAANVMVNEGAASWTSMSAAVSEAGVAQETANARMQGLAGAFEYLKGAIDSLLISSAMPFTETIANMVRQGADLLTSIGKLSPETQKWAAIIGVAAAAAGPLLIVLGTLVSAMGALLSPIGAVVVAAGLLGAAWATNFGGIQEKTAAAWAAIQPALQAAADWLQMTIPLALAVLQTAWDTVFGALSSATATASAGVGPALETLQGYLTTLGTALTGVWNTVSTFLAPAFARLGTAFGTIGTQIGTLSPVFDGFLATIQNSLASVGESFSSMWVIVQPILQAIGGALALIIDFGINLFASAVESMSAIVTPIIQQIGLLIGTLSSIFSSTVDLIVALVTGDWSTAWTEAQDIMATFGAFVLTTFQNLYDFVAAIVAAIWKAVVDTLEDLGVNVDRIMAALQNAWETVWDALTSPVETVVTAVQDFWDLLGRFRDWLSGLSIPNPFAGWTMPSLPTWMGGSGGGTPAAPPAGGGGFNAQGTPYWRGGLTWVGEEGPELVRLPAGARIWSNPESMAIAAGAGPVTFNVTVNQDLDWEELRWKLNELMRRRG